MADDIDAIVAELTRLEKAATPWPWRNDGPANDVCPECGEEIEDNAGIIRRPDGGGVCAILIDPCAVEDAAFITAARNHLGAVLAALKEARAENERLNKWGAVRRLNDEWEAEAANLRAKLQAAERERDEAVRSRDFAQDWYGQRFQRLRRWIDDEVRPLSAETATRYFSICANGTADPYESAEWRDTIHGQQFRAERAERERNALKSKLATATEALREVKEAVNDGGSMQNALDLIDSIARAALAKIEGGK